MKLVTFDPDHHLPVLTREIGQAVAEVERIAEDGERKLAAIDRDRLRPEAVAQSEREIRQATERALDHTLAELGKLREVVVRARPHFTGEAMRTRALIEAEPSSALATFATLERLDPQALRYLAGATRDLHLAAAIEAEVHRRPAIDADTRRAILSAAAAVPLPEAEATAGAKLGELAQRIDLAAHRATEATSGRTDPTGRLALALGGSGGGGTPVVIAPAPAAVAPGVA